jgi:hypothetical protein
MNALMSLSSLVVVLVDKVPAPNDVKAGWVAFGVFIALAIAVALLGVSLTRHLRKARDNADNGAFDRTDEPRPHTS